MIGLARMALGLAAMREFPDEMPGRNPAAEADYWLREPDWHWCPLKNEYRLLLRECEERTKEWEQEGMQTMTRIAGVLSKSVPLAAAMEADDRWNNAVKP